MNIIESRELSIKQLEERKSRFRKTERKRKRGKKFSKEITISSKIIFLSKERKTPPVLSNLDPILDDEVFMELS